MLKASGKYRFGCEFARFMAKNPDGTSAEVARTVGGIGPFDFSGAGVTISAIPLSIKLDNAAAVTKSISLSAAIVPSAVTVNELVAAFNIAAFPGIAATKESGTNYFMLGQSVVSAAYMQIYGQFADLVGIGQGKGTKFVKVNTLKDFSATQTEKASETITTMDATGAETDMVSDSYVKGGTGKFTDSAYDQELKAMIEGGTYVLADDKYSAPLPSATKIYWDVEVFEKIYANGSNKQNDVVGYLKTFIQSCSGSVPESASSRAWADTVYNFIATEGKDKTGTKLPWRVEEILTAGEYAALNLATV